VSEPPATAAPRVFLVVVDSTQEMHTALRYACRRAQRTSGRVALLHVIEPAERELQNWLGVGRVMEEEARAEAEQRIQALASEVYEQTGSLPTVHIRHGTPAEELVALIKEEPSISLLVLATASNASNPGPLVTWLMGNLGRKIRLPVTLVPGELGPEEVDALT
jgi:nucleotide-binding universal stress UspA family protein